MKEEKKKILKISKKKKLKISAMAIFLVLILVNVNDVANAAVSTGTVTRSFSSTTIAPGETLTVTITPAPTVLFNAPGYQVIETIPTGFILTENTAGFMTNVGDIYTFINNGYGAFTYTLTVPTSVGFYTFSGTFKDEDRNTGTVSGAYTMNVGSINGTIIGTVTNSSGAAIAGANVTTAGGLRTITNITGAYTISVAAGTYNVTASATGYNSSSANVTVVSGATITQNFLLVRVSPITDPDVAAYDADFNGIISKSEAVQSVVDYFNNQITKERTIKVVVAYFSPVLPGGVRR